MLQHIIRRSLPSENLLQDKGLHPLLAKIYALRGVKHLNQLNRNFNSLISFEQLTNINKAVEEISKALQEKKHILIVGDFDADGATSTALAVRALKAFGAAHVSFLVPNRFEYGYGLSPEIVEVAASQNPDLLITVDNGISSIEGVEKANERGIKVVITDHHLPGKRLPPAEAIVNPNLTGDAFPSKNLAGVGVIFYTMLALRAHLRKINWFGSQNLKEPNMAGFLDLVALGTVADVVPLDQNNRILVHQGLMRIRAGKGCHGINALLEVAKRKSSQLMAADLGFAVGPRLNAAGRLDDMAIGIHCLLSESLEDAMPLAQKLDQLNRERQSIETDMHEQAHHILNQLRLNKHLPMGICLYEEHWHQGVLGILASRVKEQVHRPVVVFTKASETEIKGSARSVMGVHIRDVLDNIASEHPGLMSKFGGHAMAAGLSLPVDHYPTFKEAFNKAISKQITQEELCGKIFSDGELGSDDFLLETAHLLRNGGPWGQHFPEPVFDNIFLLIDQRIVGENHLKMTLSLLDRTQYLEAIAFRVDTNQWPNYRCEKIRAAYRLDINEYRDVSKLQLVVLHLEPL